MTAPTRRRRAPSPGLVREAEALGIVLGDLGAVSDLQLLDLIEEYDIPDYPMTAHTLGERAPAALGGAAGVGAFIKQLPEVVNRYTQAAGLVTAQWYDELAPDVDFHANPTLFDIPVERIIESARWALFAPGEQPPAQRLSATTHRMINDASRETVIGNARAEKVRWARHVSATACPFCAILGTRGAVYHSEESALASHDYCGCLALPERPGAHGRAAR